MTRSHYALTAGHITAGLVLLAIAGVLTGCDARQAESTQVPPATTDTVASNATEKSAAAPSAAAD